ncbi:MAG: hypothetical protein ACYDBQ_02065 [Thermoplasmatota archaeon]
MEDRTTIQLPRPLVARLRKARAKGETYADLIGEALLALGERRAFIKEQVRRAEAVMAGRAPYRILE